MIFICPVTFMLSIEYISSDGSNSIISKSSLKFFKSLIYVLVGINEKTNESVSNQVTLQYHYQNKEFSYINTTDTFLILNTLLNEVQRKRFCKNIIFVR